MEAQKEVEQQENLSAMKLPVLPIKPNSHSHSMSSPIHSSIAASVPFSWEEEPGKPKQHSSSSSSSSSSPLTSYSSSSPQTHKSLELPPRLHSLEKDGGKLNSPITVFDGPYSMTRSRRLDSPSFRMMVKGSGDCYGSFRSDMYGDLDDVDEETKQENMSSGGSLALVKKRRGLGFFGFSRRRALKRKTEFGRGSYVFPSSVDRENESGRKEMEEGEDKSTGYGDGITCSQSSRFCEVDIANISRTGSFSTLPTPPSSSSKSHFWTNVYAGLKQVVPWKNKKTTVMIYHEMFMLKPLAQGANCDVREGKDVKELVVYSQKNLKYIDIWINNAGSNAYSFKPLSEASDEDLICENQHSWADVMLPRGNEYEVDSVLRWSYFQYRWRWLRSDGRSTPRFAAYGATKRSVVHLTKSLQEELQMQDVKKVLVYNLSPGMVTTDQLMSGATTKQAKFFINVLESQLKWLLSIFPEHQSNTS